MDILDLVRVFSRDKNHFRDLIQIEFFFHHLFTSDSRPIMTNKFRNDLLRNNNPLPKDKRSNLEERRFGMNLKLSNQMIEDWNLKTIEEHFPTLKFDSS